MKAVVTSPGRLYATEERPQAHLYVRDGRLTLAVITGVREGESLNFPDDIGAPVLIFDASYDVTVCEERP